MDPPDINIKGNVKNKSIPKTINATKVKADKINRKGQVKTILHEHSDSTDTDPKDLGIRRKAKKTLQGLLMVIKVMIELTRKKV